MEGERVFFCVLEQRGWNDGRFSPPPSGKSAAHLCEWEEASEAAAES